MKTSNGYWESSSVHVTLLSHNVVFKLYIIINYFNYWCIKVANRTEGMMKVFPAYNDCFSQVTLVDNHKV